MTARVAGAVEGRPSNARLREERDDALAALGRAHEANVNLAMELRSTRRESKAFAEIVAGGITRIREAVANGWDMRAMHEAGRVGHEADRRLAQLGSAVL